MSKNAKEGRNIPTYGLCEGGMLNNKWSGSPKIMNGLWGVRKPTNKGNFSWGLRGSLPSEKNKETNLATSKLIETIKFWKPLIL